MRSTLSPAEAFPAGGCSRGLSGGRTALTTWVVLAAVLLLPASALAQAGATDPEFAALSAEGPWAPAGYTDLPLIEEFLAATVFYPEDAPGPVPGIVIAPGFTEGQEHIWWWGARLASHGFAVLLLDTNDLREPPSDRAEALMAGIRMLQTENGRPGAPLFQRVDPSRMAVAGHSMGGGGALLAAQRYPERIRAVIPFTPWLPDPDFDRIEAPTLILAGENDRVAAVGAHAWPHFRALPRDTPRVYLEVAGGDHFISDTHRGTDLDTLSAFVIAWLRLHVEGDERYRALFSEDHPAIAGGGFSRVELHP